MRSEIRRINRLFQHCHWVPCDSSPHSNNFATPVVIDKNIDKIDDWASESENDCDDDYEKDDLEDRKGENGNENIESELEDSEGECEIKKHKIKNPRKKVAAVMIVEDWSIDI